MLLSLRNLRIVEWASLSFCYSSPPETAETVWTRAEATHRRWAHSGAESKRDATAWSVKPARENLQPMTQQSSELRLTVGTSRCFSNTLRQKLAPPSKVVCAAQCGEEGPDPDVGETKHPQMAQHRRANDSDVQRLAREHKMVGERSESPGRTIINQRWDLRHHLSPVYYTVLKILPRPTFNQPR